MPGAPHTQSRQSPNLNPRALRVGVFCCARPHLDGVLCPRVPTLVVCLRGVLFQLGGTCRRGGRCLLVVPVRVIQTRFGFLIAWRLPCFLASSRHWYNVRRGVARWQTFTRRAGVASCNTIGEQHFLLGRRFVLRSRGVCHSSQRSRMPLPQASVGEMTRGRVGFDSYLSSRGGSRFIPPCKTCCNDVITVKLHADDNRVSLPTSTHVR